MHSAEVELLRCLVGDGPPDSALVELLARCDGDAGVAANRWFDSIALSSQRIVPAVSSPPACSSATEWPRMLGQTEMQAFSVVQQHELDGPLLPDEALELQVGSSRRKSAGASSGKRRAVSAEEPQLLRFCVRGVPVGRVPAGVTKWLQPLLAEGKIEVQAAVLQAPAQLELMSSIRVRLRVCVCHAAFAEGAELARLTGGAMELEHGASERPLCSLLEALGLQPVGEPGAADAAVGLGDSGEPRPTLPIEVDCEPMPPKGTPEAAASPMPVEAAVEAAVEVTAGTAAAEAAEAAEEAAEAAAAPRTDACRAEVEAEADVKADADADADAETAAEAGGGAEADPDPDPDPDPEVEAEAEAAAAAAPRTLGLSAEQQERMARNRELALRRRQHPGPSATRQAGPGHGGELTAASKLSEADRSLIAEKAGATR